MKIAVSDHQNKARHLIAALQEAGHEILPRDKPADALLIDFDGPTGHYGRTIEMQYSYGAVIFVYSHGAAPMVAYDGIWQPSDKVSAYLAQAPGQKLVMETYGYPHPIHVIGWHYCKPRPFQPVEQVKRVLFGPWHPHANDYLHPERRNANQRVYNTLLEQAYDLTVRHIRPLYANGLDEVEGVKYVRGYTDNTLEDIDAADLVVAEGTLAYLAIARGKPVIMFGQNVQPLDGYHDDMIGYVDNWDSYADLMRYPYDYDDGDFGELVDRARRFEPLKWKERFIGQPLDAEWFGNYIDLLTHEVREQREYA